jgi:hypothetical protein
VPINKYDRHLEIIFSLTAELSECKKRLAESPQKLTLTPPSSDQSWGLDTTLAKTASDVVRHFFSGIKHGMSHVKTEKKALGWVHPTSQGRDRIVRIFPCRQFVVLRKSKDGDYY